MPTERAKSTGLSAARGLFEHAGLLAPPVPRGLKDKVRRLDKWLYGTRDVDRMAMYMFGQYPLEAAYGGTPDYVALVMSRDVV